MTSDLTINLGTSGTGNVTTLTFGSGDDTLSITGTAELEADDIVAFGTGSDTLSLNNTSAAVTVAIDSDLVTGLESIVVADSDGGNTGTAQAISITNAAIRATTTQNITIDASAITDTNDTVTANMSSGS